MTAVQTTFFDFPAVTVTPDAGHDWGTAKREQVNYDATRGDSDLWRPLPIETYKMGEHTLHRMGGLRKVAAKRFNSLEANIQPADYPAPKHNRQPLIVACGMGTDSIAMLVAMKKRGIRPDIVQWADTGSERAHTYRYVRVLQQWLKANDFPPLLVVRLICPLAGHLSLAMQLWNTEQLPSPAFHRNHSCSAKWKLDPQRKYHEFLPWICNAKLAKTAIGFSAEETGRQAHAAAKVEGPAEAVGFSKEEEGRRSICSYQMTDGDGYVTYFPLQEWDMTRADCVEEIEEEGLPLPGKSACFFCPMSKKCELRSFEGDELPAALAIEKRADEGGKLTKIRGLRKGSNEGWAEWLEREDDESDRQPFVGLVATV